MATRDSGDSNLPKEPGNEVCDIILKLRRHKGCEGECLNSIPSERRAEREVSSTGFKETEVDQSFQRNCQVCLLFKPYFVADVLDLVSPFIVVHMYEAFQGVLATGDIAQKCGDILFLIHRQPTKTDRKRATICDSDNPLLLSTKRQVCALLNLVPRAFSSTIFKMAERRERTLGNAELTPLLIGPFIQAR